jgi:arabinogalactan endo-1,4-beta-galactosidase
MNDNTKASVAVEWEKTDLEGMKNGDAKKYIIKGTAEGKEAKCHVSMVEYNYIKNWGFEEGENHWKASALSSFEEFGVEDKASDSLSGTKHYHFCGSAENSVEFTLEQDIGVIDAGKYNYSISVMGGDGGETEIYAYVKIGGEIVYSTDTLITVYDEWHTATISNFDYHGVGEITVGIYVKCQGPNAWGKIDDAIFNRVS